MKMLQRSGVTIPPPVRAEKQEDHATNAPFPGS